MLLVNVDLFCSDKGEGLPLIVHHGGPGLDQVAIENGLSPLANELRLVCFEHRGTGRSAQPNGSNPYHIDNFVEDVVALSKALGVERFAMLGHSFGGIVAQHVALAHPGLLSHLILVCAPSSDDYIHDVEAALPELLPPAALAELSRLAAGEPSKEVMRRSLELLVPVYFRDRAKVAALGLDAIKFGPASQAVWDSLEGFDLRPRLPEIEVPTLVVTGAHDRSVTPERAKETAALLPDSTLLVLEGSGHYPFLEEPGKLIAGIRAFFMAKPKKKKKGGLFGRGS